MKFRSSHIPVFIAAILLAAFYCDAQNYTISTIAGQGLMLGNGGPASNAMFGAVSAVALGPEGSLYIADSIYSQIRRVTPDGKISLVAGGPVAGFGGDGGPATAALLNQPTALLVDSGGNLYIGDSGNHRVRFVTRFGNIQTIAGNGQVPPSPSASPAYPGEGLQATAAPLNQISGLVFASNGDLIISDFGNNRVFRVSSGVITTVAGNATNAPSLAAQPAKSATLQGPTGVAADLYGNIFFSELATGVVRMVDTKGNLTVLAGTGVPGQAPISSGSPLAYPLVQPVGMASDGSFHLYVMEAGRVSMYSPPNPATGAAAIVQTVAGNLSQVTSGTGDGGSPLSAGMNPRSVTVDNQGNIYIADSLTTLNFNNRVRWISTYSGKINTVAGGKAPTGAGDNGAATSAQLNLPQAVAVNPAGGLFIADTGDNRIRAVAPNGTINTIAGTGTTGASGDGGPAASASITQPAGLALDSAGNLYFTDGSRVREVMNGSGIINTFAGGGTSTQEGAPANTAMLTQTGSLAIDSQNDVFVDQAARVSEISAAAQTIATVAGIGIAGNSGDGGPATAAQINSSSGVAVDGAGNLYIADQANQRIRKVDSTGNITTVAGGGTATDDGVAATSALLTDPVAVAVDGTGNLYIADYGSNRIRMVGQDGNIHTIAGNGLAGFKGDGAVAVNASLNGPTDVKLDGQGNIYIADSLNSAIRMLSPIASLPTPAITAIVNDANLATGALAPGERVLITGTNLGPKIQVMFDQYPAPVLVSSLTSAVAVVPYEVANQTNSQVTVVSNGVTSAAFVAQITSSSPGIFTNAGDGTGQAIAIGQNGLPNSAANPVQGGEVISILCTGEGVDRPASVTGVPTGPMPPSPMLPVTVTIDGEQAQVNQAYSLTGAIGQFVVDVLVPLDVNTESGATVVITVGNNVSQNTATIALVAAPDDSGDNSSQLRKAVGKRF